MVIRSNARLQRGMTLIELAITLVLMAMLLLMAIPFARAWVDSNRQLQVRSQLWEAVAQARALALRNPSAISLPDHASALLLYNAAANTLSVEPVASSTASSTTDIPVTWSANLVSGARMQVMDAAATETTSNVLAEAAGQPLSCIAFNDRGQIADVGTTIPGCMALSARNQKIALYLNTQSPIYVHVF